MFVHCQFFLKAGLERKEEVGGGGGGVKVVNYLIYY